MAGRRRDARFRPQHARPLRSGGGQRRQGERRDLRAPRRPSEAKREARRTATFRLTVARTNHVRAFARFSFVSSALRPIRLRSSEWVWGEITAARTRTSLRKRTEVKRERERERRGEDLSTPPLSLKTRKEESNRSFFFLLGEYVDRSALLSLGHARERERKRKRGDASKQVCAGVFDLRLGWTRTARESVVRKAEGKR